MGKAQQYTPGVVTIDELNLYVKERVKELTGGLQHPVDLKPKEARNIPFAMVPRRLGGQAMVDFLLLAAGARSVTKNPP